MEVKLFANTINIIRVEVKFVVGHCFFVDLFPKTFRERKISINVNSIVSV